jgi:hypothetical protein
LRSLRIKVRWLGGAGPFSIYSTSRVNMIRITVAIRWARTHTPLWLRLLA